MGTNFYWHIPELIPLPTGEQLTVELDDPAVHIGKRSAAGWYCWDCRATFCLTGEGAIHYSALSRRSETCPRCGAEKPDLKLRGGAAGIELGFRDADVHVPTGVGTVCSFNWAQDPDRVRRTCAERPDESLIEDEYGRDYTGQEFLDMLAANCPIEYTDSVGRRFS